MERPWIGCVDEDEAEGELRDVYQQWFDANPGRDRIPDILKCFSLRPDLLKPLLGLTYPLHFENGFLDRKEKEMLATYVSGINECDY